jgi:hypothetical protein
MKLSRVLSFAFLCAATTVLAQDLIRWPPGAVPSSPPPAYHGKPVYLPGYNCPVDMAIARGGLYAKREVRGAPNSGPNPQLEQRIRLDLTNRNPAKVTAAQITIHGLSQKGRFIEVSTPQADLAKTIQLSLDLEGNGQSSNVLWLNRFAVVTRVDLNSVTYADGSAWRESSPAECSVAPSLLVPVTLEH